MRILYKILSFCLFLNCIVVSAQTGTSSPYSMYGVGDINPMGFGRNRALGGAGIALPTDVSLNNINPASYSTIDSLAFMTDFGLDFKSSKLKSGSLNQSTNNAGLGFLAIGFRNTKWWKNSIGLMPFSSVGNNVNTTKDIEGSTDKLKINIEGSGGLSQVYWGNAFKILPNLSIGVNFAFIFGSLTQTQTTTSPSVFNGSLVNEDNIYLHKLYVNYGAQYSFKLAHNIKGAVGLIYGGPCKLNMFHNITSTDNTSTILKDNATSETSFTLPSNYGIGGMIKFNDKLLLTADYKFNNWSQSQPYQSTVRFVNSSNYMAGIEFTPSNSFRDQGWKRMTFRMGGYINNTYIMLNSYQLVDKGLTFGLGVPLIQKKMNFNFVYQVGQKSSLAKGSIIENYQNFSVNITLFDFWFIKPKFD